MLLLKRILLVGVGLIIAAVFFFNLKYFNSKKASSTIQLPQKKTVRTEKSPKKNSSLKKGDEKYREITWKELVQLDYKTGEKKGNLKELEGKMVRLPGYIVPLTDSYVTLDQFLFVPNDQACIHVPPPPPNLVVNAKLKEKLSFEKVYNPSWIMGKLEIVDTHSKYGRSGYRIFDATIEKYE